MTTDHDDARRAIFQRRARLIATAATGALLATCAAHSDVDENETPCLSIDPTCIEGDPLCTPGVCLSPDPIGGAGGDGGAGSDGGLGGALR